LNLPPDRQISISALTATLLDGDLVFMGKGKGLDRRDMA
jgi:hypothetical protein